MYRNRTRKDKVVSVTMSPNMLSLMDAMAGYKNMGRSEIVRFMIVRLGEEFGESFLYSVLAEEVAGTRGRMTAEQVEKEAVDLTDEYLTQTKKWSQFFRTESIAEQYIQNVDGKACIIVEDKILTYEEFQLLTRTQKEEVIQVATVTP